MSTSRFAAAALLSAGLVVAAPATAIADDSKTVRGSCSGSSDYVFTLRDLDDPDRLSVRFTVDGTRAGVAWKVTMKRGDQIVHRDTKRANRYGNVTFASTFRGDDDARVTVIARAAYGETCKRALRLDD